jgi:cyclophilin family peptidyl-prolyl cis-trans isomerase
VRVRTALILLTACATGVFAGCGGDEVDTGGGNPPPATTAATTTARATTTEAAEPEITKCLDSGQPAPAKKEQYSKAEQVLKDGVDYTIVMKTSCGTLNITLDPKAGGPIPNSIAFLASKGFYDGLTFHRVVPEFVLQGGDPDGNGTGGAGYQVVGPVPEGYQYKLGDVAMAKTQTDPAGASGSQFFVVSGPQGESVLTSSPVYGILGHAADAASLATIKRVAALAVTDGPPSKPVWIISATLQPAA